jgi:hypothetical protein
MRTDIDVWTLLAKAHSAFLVVMILLLLAGLCIAQTQTFCGTKRCTVSQDLQGKYSVEFWCQGQYPLSGTCTGPPHLIILEKDPTKVSCSCPSGKCGSGSTIAAHIACGSDNQSASYQVNCAANNFLVTVTVSSTLGCCITCDPNASGGGSCASCAYAPTGYYCSYQIDFTCWPYGGCPSGTTPEYSSG